MVTAFFSPEMISQKAHVAGITGQPSPPGKRQGAISNQTQVPDGSRRKPQRSAIALTSWKPRPPSSCPPAWCKFGRPVHPSSTTSTWTTAPRRITATVTRAASAASCTALVTSSQASSSASQQHGWSASTSWTNRRAAGTSSARRARVRVALRNPAGAETGAETGEETGAETGEETGAETAKDISASAIVLTTVRAYNVTLG